jgi:transcriptional regulator of acetoin/glycerol metabolism
MKKQAVKTTDIFESCAEIVDSILTQKISIQDGLELIECAMIIEALNQTNGNNTQASKLLGLNRTTFVMKIRRLLYLKDKLPNELKVEII